MNVGDKMGVTYSEATKENYEKYCRENMLVENRTDKITSQYRNERALKTLYTGLWLMFWVYIIYKTIIVLTHRYRYVALTVNEICIMAGILLLGIIMFRIGLKAIKKSVPVYNKIEREVSFKMIMQVYFYPLLELQDEFRAGLVERVHINPKRNVIGVEISTSAGLKRKDYYLYGGIKSYLRNGSLDFTYIDAFIKTNMSAISKL